MRALRLLPLLLILALALGSAVGTAYAHAIYQSSQPEANAILPAPPAGITVRLTERVSPGSASLAVTDSAGAHFERNATRISSIDTRVISTDVAPIDPGVYTVVWRVTSADDGHPSAGAFSFCVQDLNGTCTGSEALGEVETGASAPFSGAEVLLRAASYFATAAAVGAVGMATFVWRAATPGLSGPAASSGRDGMRWLMLWGGGNALGLAAYSTAWLAWSLLDLAGSDPGRAIGGSVFLQSLATRAVLAGGLGVLLLLLHVRLLRDRSATLGAAPLLAALVVSIALVGVIAAASHAAASAAAPAWAALADGVHLLFVCVWAGGLIGLVVVGRTLRGAPNALLARRALTRFSTVAAISVAGVLAAGVLLSVSQVGSLENLTSSPFGLVVLTKVCLAVPMVALGAHNRWVSVPLLPDPSQVVAAAARAARNIRAEAALGAAVLAVAGLLTTLVPATSVDVPPGEPPQFLLRQERDGIQVELQVYPPPTVPREYILSVLLTDAATGALYLNSTNATATFVLTNSTLPSVREAMSGPHDNHYFVNTTAISSPGQWRVDIAIQRTDGFDITATFHVNIREVAPPG
ncbi:MAG TPA: CopD family protein [Candidatus Thermoplasmatota archaeon]